MAVYTDVPDGDLRDFLAEYDLGTLVAFRGIAEGVENSNYSLRTTSGDFILTLYERRVAAADLPWFLGFMQHLAAAGISCPLPVAGRDGSALRHLRGRCAAITTFLPGVWPRRVNVAHCGMLGEAMARLHLAGQGFRETRKNALGPGAWSGILDSCRDGADSVLPGLAATLDTALRRVTGNWPQDLPPGQIHADLFPDNVFFLEGRLSGMIDFYFACTDMLAYDIAVCLNAWCFGEAHDFIPSHGRALLEGYESIRALTGEERAALPLLSQGAALRFLLTRLHDWLHTPEGALVTKKNPLDYLHRLNFHAGIKDFHAYGV
jgi:homoserine kinase type II